MSYIILDLNDSEIRVAAGTEIILREPGYAVLKPDRIITGLEAWNIARRNPREVSNRFWNQLNQDSISIPSSLARHNADLVFNQLINIHEKAGKPDEILFSVPGFYTREQLSLLLGVVEACPFSAIGLVDSAVASVSGFAGPGKYYQLDINLYNTVITTINVGAKVIRESVKVIDNVGLSEIYDASANLISDLFIDQTRFDPLHHAETEQILYNNIASCLRKLSTQQETSIEIQYKNSHYHARIARETLIQRLNMLYQKIYREVSEATVTLISDRLHDLPGFSDPLANSIPVDESSVFRGCEINLDKIRSTGPALTFITELPAAASPVKPAVKQETKNLSNHPQPAVKATHILISNQAYPLSPNPVYISHAGSVRKSREKDSQCSLRLNGSDAEVEVFKEQAVFKNGKPVQGKTRAIPGDIIRFAGNDVFVQCIEVLKR
jgi:hypothetical protein